MNKNQTYSIAIGSALGSSMGTTIGAVFGNVVNGVLAGSFIGIIIGVVLAYSIFNKDQTNTESSALFESAVSAPMNSCQVGLRTTGPLLILP